MAANKLLDPVIFSSQTSSQSQHVSDRNLIILEMRERAAKIRQSTFEYTSETIWKRLPRELALLILSHLDTASLLVARRVCTVWRRFATDIRDVRCSLSTRIRYILALLPQLQVVRLDRKIDDFYLIANQREPLWQELHKRDIRLDVSALVHPPLESTGLPLLPSLVNNLKKQKLWRYALAIEYVQMTMQQDNEICGLQTAFDLHESQTDVSVFVAAQADLKQLFDKHKTSRYLLTVLPVVLFRAEMHHEAIAISDHWISSQPTCVGAFIARGRLLGWMNRFAEAATAFSRGIDIARSSRIPDTEAVLLDDRAMAYSSMECYEEAIRDYEASIQLQPNEPGIYVDYGYTLYNLGRLDEAVESASRSISLQGMSTGYNMRGWARVQQERYEDAFQDFQAALDSQGVFLPIPTFGQAETRFHIGQYEEAVKLSTKVIESNGPPLTSALYIRAMSFRALGRETEAQQDIDRMMGLTPHYSYERVATALVLIEREETTRALTLLNQAVQIQPGNWRYRVARGNLLGPKLSRWSEALADWRRAIQLHPASRTRINEAHLAEAMRLERQGAADD